MFEELGDWRVQGLVNGVVRVSENCRQTNPEEAVQLAFRNARVRYPDVREKSWQFVCRRSDWSESATTLCFGVARGEVRRVMG